MAAVSRSLARRLVLDELFDLTLYRRLLPNARADERALLEALIPMEVKHLQFWQQFFNLPLETLNLTRRLKLSVMVVTARAFGPRFTHLLLESIEVYGIRKYLVVWDAYRGTPFGGAVESILRDELQHEDEIVSRFQERRVSGESVRNIFLGINDGLVEMLGAVSGFFAALDSASHVFLAALAVAVAGSFSMAASVLVSSGSEREVEGTLRRKAQFLAGEPLGSDGGHPFGQAVVVGVAYFVAALVPILPVFLGAETVLAPLLAAGLMIAIVSFILAFISGMNIKRRISTNVLITAAAVVVTYAVSTLAKRLWGLPA